MADGFFMQLFYFFECVFESAIYRCDDGVESGLFAVGAEFVLCDFGVDFLIEFAEVFEDSVHFFEFFYNEVVFLYDGLHGDSSSYKHLIDGDEFC